ncbi:hypothetical protein PPL_09909 [Heterostelium album PN500]|uniref:Uncharacterized protein n=1 Tax=Heterostelium pallidum (strain ATCC 26659 / Pp 5 / PN500) TaxID=670386 RepID=D3BPP2_HETP5|nr:hypothetical protein PPL_09909 [Heterostelium album PN500]EFA76604.1 hypothetical protein PPL_09909 [Heterostelium album PN500]|eukprot:XP_020428736.1 hypothetical protein PPL_09909 [Heterostelium album PN500]
MKSNSKNMNNKPPKAAGGKSKQIQAGKSAAKSSGSKAGRKVRLFKNRENKTG